MDFAIASLRSDSPHVVFQECPGDIALCFSFYGCPLRCEGCHSQELWQVTGGKPLTPARLEQYLDQYDGLITAVVMFGGEWAPLELQALLIKIQGRGLKSYLYSGLNHVSRHLRPYLNFVKLGPWRTEQGGLSNPASNQRFYRIIDGQLAEDQTYLFQNSTPTNENANKDAYHAAA